MGRTYKKNDRWKKDRRDQNFKKSKKFKKLKNGNNHSSPKPQPVVVESTEIMDDVNTS